MTKHTPPPKAQQPLSADEHAQEGDSRQKPRNALFMMTQLTFLDGDKQIDVRVRNISSGGMMVESSIYCEQGDRLLAELRNIGKVKGRVSWREANHFGIAFDEPIDADDVRFKSSPDKKGEKPAYLRSLEEKHRRPSPEKIRRI